MDFHWKHCRSQDSTSQQGGCQDSLALKLNGYAKKINVDSTNRNAGFRFFNEKPWGIP